MQGKTRGEITKSMMCKDQHGPSQYFSYIKLPPNSVREVLFFRVPNQICQSLRTIAEILEGPYILVSKIKVQSLAEI